MTSRIGHPRALSSLLFAAAVVLAVVIIVWPNPATPPIRGGDSTTGVRLPDRVASVSPNRVPPERSGERTPADEGSTIRGAVVGVPSIALADAGIALMVGERRLARVACAADGSFVFHAVKAPPGARFVIEGSAVEADPLAVPRAQPSSAGEINLSPIVARLAVELPVVLRLHEHALTAFDSVGATLSMSVVAEDAAGVKRAIAVQSISPGRHMACTLTIPMIDTVGVRVLLHPRGGEVPIVVKEAMTSFRIEDMRYASVQVDFDERSFVYGEVVDHRGRSLPGCDVDWDAPDGHRSYRTAVDGRFMIPAIGRDSVLLSASFGRVATSEQHELATGPLMQQIRIDTSKCVCLRLLSPSGHPVERYGVRTNNRYRRPLDRDLGVQEAPDGIVVLKRHTLPRGARLYFFGEGFNEFAAEFPDGLAGGLVREVFVIPTPEGAVRVEAEGAIPAASAVTLEELDPTASPPWRLARQYVMSVATEPGVWAIERVAVGTYSVTVETLQDVVARGRIDVRPGMNTLRLRVD
jgi:hypothetical protein